MAQGEFTKEEAEATRTAVSEVMDAMPKKMLANYLGHFNDILLFVEAAKKVAPNEKKPKT